MCLFESHEALMAEIKKLEHVLKVTVRKELAILMFAALELLEKKCVLMLFTAMGLLSLLWLGLISDVAEVFIL
ncbi:unknown [Eggerthella sp. CAG:368]|nr:unknown [Eggerthella sp. CAG:368]